MKQQAITKAASVALAGVLALGVSSAYAQASGGGMSDSQMASGTMGNMGNMSNSQHKTTKHHAKKSGAASMSHEASGANAQ
jgi:hypothetical protein